MLDSNLARALLATCCILTLPTFAGEPPRAMRSLNDDWRFHLGAAPEAKAPTYHDQDWRRVDLPHDYAVEGTFTREDPFQRPGEREDWHWYHAFLPVSPAVYRKEFTLPANVSGKRVWIEFDGVFSNSRYWLNGRTLGEQYSGYTRSRFDLTPVINISGPNVLVVELEPHFDGWWYEGGGIYRDVRIVTVDPLHIAPDGVFVAPSVEDVGDGDRADAQIGAYIDVTNASSASASVRVTNEVLNATDQIVATASSVYEVGISAGLKVTQRMTLPQAYLWSPDRPYLYRLRTTVASGGRVVDQLTTNFGVRHVRFDAERGLFLNGKHVKLKGVNMHQDHAGVGVAMPDRLFTWRLERLKEVGCNAIRMSHNPVTPFLLDECDRMGFLVIAENRHFGDTYQDQATADVTAVDHRDLSELVTRDRNHPSIILWSLCNEQWIQGTKEAAALARAMKQRVLELDPTRPVTAALNGGFDTPEGLISVLDVVGINYNPWVYDDVHKQFSSAPIIASEIASEISTRGVYKTEPWENYFGDRERGHLSAYSISAGPAGQTVENAWPPVATRDFIAGGFVWAAFDYKGEPRPFGWPVINCHYGFMDICGFPKDSYYYYKARWSDEPVLHVFPHWNWPEREGEEIPVWVHSNCDEVELFLNGVPLGRGTVKPLHHLEWKVKYAPGRLVAKGSRAGKTIEAMRETTGAPAAIRLTADRSDLAADNADLAVITVEVVDTEGRLVPIASDQIAFSLAGPAKLLGVGNGDPSSHEPDQASRRSVFNGLAQALVGTTHTSGEIILQAEAPGLSSGRVTLRSR